jgi:flagellin-specific chaperone FliS
MLIDVAIPGDRNVIKEEEEKILKCKDLIIEIQRTLNVEAQVIAVIIRSNWNFFKITQTILEKHYGKARN